MEGLAVFILIIAIRVAFGAATAAIASSKGRNTVGWFFAGFLIDCIALVIILCLSNLKEEEAKWRRAEGERRRLREQLKQERLKTEAFHGHVQGRLDVHDEALGLDTRQLTGKPEPTEAALPPPVPASEAGEQRAADATVREWFVELDGRRSDPMTIHGLRELYHAGRIHENTLVWTAGMDSWRPVCDVPDLPEELR